MTGETSVKLPVTVTRNKGRDKSARYTATYGPWQSPIEAEGATLAEAKASLVALLVTAIDGIRRPEPQFARDDLGATYVAIADIDGGSRWYRVTQDRATLTTYSSQPTSEAFTSCVGMTVVPSR